MMLLLLLLLLLLLFTRAGMSESGKSGPLLRLLFLLLLLKSSGCQPGIMLIPEPPLRHIIEVGDKCSIPDV
jgi:hypothetical protein